MIDVTVSLPIHLAVLELKGLRVERDPRAHVALCACGQRYAALGVEAPGDVPGVEHARCLFRALGIDPTKRRPSSEALLNRALKGKPLPGINTLVDVGNWCSLDFLLPLGLYDRDRIRGRVALRQGREGEGYRAIGDKDMHLAGRYLLADDEGAFGSPMTDSLRTAVSEATTAAAVFLYAPLDYDLERLRAQAGLMAERIVEHCGGRAEQIDVLAGAATPRGTLADRTETSS